MPKIRRAPMRYFFIFGNDTPRPGLAPSGVQAGFSSPTFPTHETAVAMLLTVRYQNDPDAALIPVHVTGMLETTGHEMRHWNDASGELARLP